MNDGGLDYTSGISNCVKFNSSGTMTVSDTSQIMAGQYGGNGIGLDKTCTLNLTGNSCIYATNTTSVKNCVSIPGTNCRVTFNSTGYFYCTSNYVANASTRAATYTITKGHFVSRSHKYMFYQGGKADTTNVSTQSSAGNRKFRIMNGYNSTQLILIPDCYYYAKGV